MNTKLKAGDEIEIIGDHPNAGCQAVIREWGWNGDSRACHPGCTEWAVESDEAKLHRPDDNVVTTCQIKLIKGTTMALTPADLRKVNLTPDQRFLADGGYTCPDGALNQAGTAALIEFLRDQNEAAFVAALKAATPVETNSGEAK